jgi:hypothetical protein
MKALTHITAGGAAGAGLILVVGMDMDWETALLVGAVGACVPQMEYAFFRLARELRARQVGGPWLRAASKFGQERGPWHGMEILVLLGGLVGLTGWLLDISNFALIFVAFLGGWLSHLLLDLFNGGIRPLAILMPYRWAYFPPWGTRRVVRGGLFEGLVLLGTGWVWIWRLVERLLPLLEGRVGRWL